jgi:hypothetical protein
MYVARIFIAYPTNRIPLKEFYSLFRKFVSRGWIASFSKHAIRAVLRRFREKELIDTNPQHRLPARLRRYWLTDYGRKVLIEAVERYNSDSVGSQEPVELVPVSSSALTEPTTDSLQVIPQFMNLKDFMDLKAARLENVRIKTRIDLHIGRHIHESCEKGPSRRDRSEKKTHSEDSFTLMITKDAWMMIWPKRPDFPKKLCDWLESVGTPPADIMHVVTDIMNQSRDINAILEIPAKQYLPPGHRFFRRLQDLSSHKGCNSFPGGNRVRQKSWRRARGTGQNTTPHELHDSLRRDCSINLARVFRPSGKCCESAPITESKPGQRDSGEDAGHAEQNQPPGIDYRTTSWNAASTGGIF